MCENTRHLDRESGIIHMSPERYAGHKTQVTRYSDDTSPNPVVDGIRRREIAEPTIHQEDRDSFGAPHDITC